MPELNLLESTPRIVRDVASRRANKEANRAAALRFDVEYFDGPRAQGYGGYRYDGRWVAVAKRIIEHWGLREGDRVLDLGCAKGFLVKDLSDALPLRVFGLDVSRYAIAHAHPDVRGRLVRGSCDRLPFPTASFDAALAINVVHNLEPAACVRAIQEIERVAPGRGFVQVDSYRDEAERHLFEDWMLTARTYLRPDGWLRLFEEAGYTGAYYWTILEVDSRWNRS